MNAVRLARQDRAAEETAVAAPGEPSPPSETLFVSARRRISAAPRSRYVGRVVVAMRDTGRRNIYFSVAAVPSHLLMAGWKSALMIVSPSLFMLANVVFTLGMAGVKLIVVLADRRHRRTGDETVVLRAYRVCGIVLLGLSLAYAALCVPLVLGEASTERYTYELAIAIATVTFVELGFALHGFVSSRRRGDLLMEAVKLSNLAASLIFLVLTQTALLSMTSDTDHSRYNGICGIVMGTGAALIALRPVLRRVHREPDTARSV